MVNILISNPEKLQEKVEKFKGGGAEKIHVLTDFDRTLTHGYYQGKRTPSLISHLRNGNYLSAEYAATAFALYDKYHPIEINPTINLEEKKMEMKNWWIEHFALLVKSGLTRDLIKKCANDMVKEGEIRLREGAKEFLKTLEEKNIPLVVISSSIGDLISDYLKIQGVLSKNIDIIGNILEYDEKGAFTGVKNNKVIHVLNKSEVELHDLPVFKEIEKCKNVILLGDSIGDLDMVEGFDFEEIIKIGFYDEEEGNLEFYKKSFDILVMKDGGMEGVNELMREILDIR